MKMNTVFLKIAGGVLLLFVILIVAFSLFSSDSTDSDVQEESSEVADTKPQNKTIYDVAEEDKKKYAIPPVTNIEPEVATPQPTPPATPASTEVQVKPTIIYVKPLGEIEDIQAQQLFSAVVPGKSIGGMRAGYNLTVQNARQILQSYPDSIYAFQAKRVLAAIPERYRSTYRLTDKVLDLSMFFKKRPGTKPMQVELDD